MRTICRPPQGPADRAGSAGRLGPVAAEERPDRGQQPGRVIALHVVARVRDGDHRGVADQGRERGGLVGGEQIAIGAAEDQGGAGYGLGQGSQRRDLLDQRGQALAGQAPLVAFPDPPGSRVPAGIYRPVWAVSRPDFTAAANAW